jgi:RNA polymerase sigma factor (sigma-70 family)
MTDAELLNRYLQERDAVAFAALVRRHGPLVLGVCGRVLRNHHNAEDAYQATFIVLARNARSIRRRDSLGAWLYGVALRKSKRLREALAKRAAREKQFAQLPAPEMQPNEVDPDLIAILKRALINLPQIYAVPIQLCDLNGKGRAEAARQLGWPLGTLSGRLFRARRLLARRLDANQCRGTRMS